MVIISDRDSGKKRQSQYVFSLTKQLIFKLDHKETKKCQIIEVSIAYDTKADFRESFTIL